jgi:hypothetical protein
VAPLAVKVAAEPVHTAAGALTVVTGLTEIVTAPDKLTEEHAVVEILIREYVVLDVNEVTIIESLPLAPIVVVCVDTPSE